MIVYKVCRETQGRYFSANPLSDTVAQFLTAEGDIPYWARQQIAEYKIGEKTTFLSERPGFTFAYYADAKGWITPSYPADENLKIFRAEVGGVVRHFEGADEEWCQLIPQIYKDATVLATEITLLALVAEVVDKKLVEHE